MLSEWDLDASAFVVKEIIVPVASGISTGLPRTVQAQ